MSFILWKREMAVFKKNAPGIVLPGIMLPLIILIAVGKLMGRSITLPLETDYFTFAASGILVITMMTMCTFVTGFDYLTDFKQLKNYEELLAAPFKVREIILGRAMGTATKALAGGAVLFGISLLLGAKYHFSLPGAVLGIFTLLLAGLFFCLFSIISAVAAPNHDAFSGMLNLVVMPLMFFSETFFEQGILGSYSWLLYCSPLYYMVNIFRDCALGKITTETFLFLLVVLVLDFVLLNMAAAIFRKKLID